MQHQQLSTIVEYAKRMQSGDVYLFVMSTELFADFYHHLKHIERDDSVLVVGVISTTPPTMLTISVRWVDKATHDAAHKNGMAYHASCWLHATTRPKKGTRR